MALACATFPLVWVGGLVTTYDAGMAVPDWPNTFGYNLFLYPWQTWLFGPFDLLIEHGHRLLGALVGCLAIGFVVLVFARDRRRGIRIASIVALLLVVIQGILGGIRVRLDERGLAMIHGCFGLGTFGYLAAMVNVTSRYWAEHQRLESSKGSERLRRLCVLMTILVYIQIVLGAMLRHVPVAASPQFFQFAVVFHLLMAGALLVHVILVSRVVGSQFRRERKLVYPTRLLLALFILQLVLGFETWVLKYGWPVWFTDLPIAAGFTIEANSLVQALVTTAHVAVGALIFAASVTLSLRTVRYFRTAPVSAGSGVFFRGFTT